MLVVPCRVTVNRGRLSLVWHVPMNTLFTRAQTCQRQLEVLLRYNLLFWIKNCKRLIAFTFLICMRVYLCVEKSDLHDKLSMRANTHMVSGNHRFPVSLCVCLYTRGSTDATKQNANLRLIVCLCLSAVLWYLFSLCLCV